MAAKIEAMLARTRGPWLARVDARLAAQSWDRSWARMAALLDDVLGARARRRGAARRVAAGAAHV
jgi:acyl carrier protein phosphodiesterase